MEFKHYSVLLEESVEGLGVKENGIYVDGTLGGGGHADRILSQNNSCRLIGIDQDSDAHRAAAERLKKFGARFTPVKNNFKNITAILREQEIDAIDGAVLDLGVSPALPRPADRS